MLEDILTELSEEGIKAALRDLQKRQTSDPNWNPAVDGRELIRLQGLLKQPLLEPITQAEREALHAQGLKPVLSPVEQKLVVRANEKAQAQKPPQPGGKRS
ncbi:MAG: hypothetical protein WCT22_00780 [Patescibacteria group bacterium]|jgi:hypothetical protein